MVASVVISPADGLTEAPEKTVAFGVPRFVRFSRLKISDLNCKFTRSDRAVFLKTDRSTSARPGPLYTPRPKFPNVPAAGWTKAAGSYQRPCWPSRTGPVIEGFIEGRSGFLILPSAVGFAPNWG